MGGLKIVLKNTKETLNRHLGNASSLKWKKHTQIIKKR